MFRIAAGLALLVAAALAVTACSGSSHKSENPTGSPAPSGSAPSTPSYTPPELLRFQRVTAAQNTKLEDKIPHLAGVQSTAYYPDKTFEVYLDKTATAADLTAITAAVSKVQGRAASVETPAPSATD